MSDTLFVTPTSGCRDPNTYEWSLIRIPILLNISALISLSFWWMSLKRINLFRQLRQVGKRVGGVVRSSRADGQNSFTLTVRFPAYVQMPGEQNFSTESTEDFNGQEAPRRIHGWATKEYNVSSNEYMTAVRVHAIEMVFDPSAGAPKGLAAPAYLLNRSASLGIVCSTIWLLTPTVLLLLFGVNYLPQCALFHTGPCIPYWLVGYSVPVLIMVLCRRICKGKCTYSDLEFEMETLNEDAIPVEAI